MTGKWGSYEILVGGSLQWKTVNCGPQGLKHEVFCGRIRHG